MLVAGSQTGARTPCVAGTMQIPKADAEKVIAEVLDLLQESPKAGVLV